MFSNESQQRRLFSIRDHLLSPRVNQLASVFASPSAPNHESQSVMMNSKKSFEDAMVKAKIHPDVKNALAQNKPVVALESTIISHGSYCYRNC